MAYCLNKSPALDSVLLTSCKSLEPNLVSRDDQNTGRETFNFVNYQSDYWNIDDILAEEELIPCEFKDDAHNLEYLDHLDSKVSAEHKKRQQEHSGTLKKGTKVDLPLWLGIALAERGMCNVYNPVYLTEKYLNLLKAGSEVVNLRNHSATIYENILKLCSHLGEDHVHTFITRYQETFIDRFTRLIIDLADSTEVQQNDQFTHDLKRLANLEREIFDMHKRQRISFQVYKNKTK